MQILIMILAYVAAVGILVTVHEFGHFITARRLGIRCCASPSVSAGLSIPGVARAMRPNM